MSDVDSYVKQLDEKHNPAGVPDTSRIVFPDGKYKTRLDKLYFGKSKNENTPRNQCVMEFEIMQGTYAFRKIYKYSGMMTADQLDWLTNDLRRLGITNFRWSNVQDQFKNVLDKFYEIELSTKMDPKTKKGFQRVFIQRALKSDELMIGDGLKDEKDVPF